MLTEQVNVPKGVNVKLEGEIFSASGKFGETKRRIAIHGVKLEVTADKVTLSIDSDNRTKKKMLETNMSHIRNMLKGASDGYTYKLKVCYVHFPCTVKLDGNRIVIENFLGERTPRYANKLPGTEVKIAKQDITVTGADLEAVSQTAANIERAARITHRDRRVFQDGIFITQKAD